MKTINVNLEPASVVARAPMVDDELGPWLTAQLARFTYKPGWTFFIVPTGRDLSAMGAEWALRIVVEVQDAYNPRQRIVVASHYPIWNGEFLTEEWFTQMVMKNIQGFEIHESREWFRVDGEIYDNPHRED